MTDKRALDIGSLHAADAAGGPASETIETVPARIGSIADPGVF